MKRRKPVIMPLLRRYGAGVLPGVRKAQEATKTPKAATSAAAKKLNSGDTASHNQPAAIPPKDPPKPYDAIV